MVSHGLINRIVVAVLSFIAMVAAVIYGSNYTTRFYLADIAERGQSTLRLSVAGLRGGLSRFQYLPRLLAKDSFVRQILVHPNHPNNPGLAGPANSDLERIADETGAAAVFVMGKTGMVIAASDSASEQTLRSSAIASRPFFRRAIEGSAGHYFALGSPAGNRGYFFAAPVYAGRDVIGAVAVKVAIESIEKAWTSPTHEILVTDDRGIVFMASRTDWRFRSLEPLSEEAQKSIAASRQYAGRAIVPLDMRHSKEQHASRLGETVDLVAVSGPWGTSQYLTQTMAMPETGWTVHVLSKTDSARNQATIFTIIAALLMLILVMFFVFLWQRRARLVERIALQREAQDMLEKRVEERTASLNQANIRLVSEVSEREAAEQELRKTQEDLIQAGKLAALGQMSTALSHEFNQPLAAIRSYADNADILLERDRVGEARDNVQRISALTDRMASISKHLRNFARKPGEKAGAVSLRDVVRDTLELLAGKISSAQVDVDVTIKPDDLFVAAGHVRLQQVLVNLTANAIDAMQDVSRPRLEIHASRAAEDDWVQIVVRDVGPGVSDAVIEQVFDPFYTTKDVGQGLGLGLSISFNIIKDFGGMLRVANHPDGGAVFTVTLRQADAADDAPAGVSTGGDGIEAPGMEAGVGQGMAAE